MTLRKLIACLHDIFTPLHPSLEWSLWVRLAVLLCKKAGFGNAESTRKWGALGVDSVECLRLLGGKDYLLAGGASASSAQEGVQRAIAKVGCSGRHANTLNNSPFDSCLFTINHPCLRVSMSCWGPVTSDASLARLGSLFFRVKLNIAEAAMLVQRWYRLWLDFRRCQFSRPWRIVRFAWWSRALLAFG